MTGAWAFDSQTLRFVDPLVHSRSLEQPPSSGDEGQSHVSGSTSSYQSYGKRSPKVKDPPMLINGVDPTFPAWRKLLLGKFLRNDDYFCSDTKRIAYMFGITSGTAQKLLNPLYLMSSLYTLTTSQQIINYLATYFENK
jgi:hypothetical protein